MIGVRQASVRDLYERRVQYSDQLAGIRNELSLIWWTGYAKALAKQLALHQYRGATHIRTWFPDLIDAPDRLHTSHR